MPHRQIKSKMTVLNSFLSSNTRAILLLYKDVNKSVKLSGCKDIAPSKTLCSPGKDVKEAVDMIVPS